MAASSCVAAHTRRAAAVALGVLLAGCGGSASDPQAPPTGNDVIPPSVTSVTPPNAATDIGVNSSITATFSEPITSASATTTSVTLVSELGSGIAGTVSANGNSATFVPSASLAANTRYIATIAAAVLDAAGNALASSYTWSFTTGADPDLTPPTVTGTSPQNGATGVAFNTVASVTFSEPMSNASLTAASVIVAANGSEPVAGTVHVTGSTATFAPTVDFRPSTLYSVTITTAVKDAAGNALARNFVWTFTTGDTPDETPPTVVSTTPPTGAAGVTRNPAVSATFSETMSDATLTTSSFTLTPTAGGNAIAGAVTLAGTVATFTPAVTLAGSTQFTATITTAAMDAAGNALASDYAWTFTTSAAPDVTPPTIVANTPVNGATGLGLNATASVTFSEPMSNGTITPSSFTLVPTAGGATISGAVTVSGNTATFTPAANLAGSTQYTATVTTAVRDAAGNALVANASWSFTTGAAPDITPPTILATSPAGGATGVSRTAPVSATFSEPMNNATLTTSSFTVTPTAGGSAIAGTVAVSGNTATFTPAAPLAGTTEFTATITTAVKDVAGNALAATSTWNFTTAAAPDVTPPIITGNTPANGATGVALDVEPTVTFSEPMTNGTITTSSFTLAPTAGGPAVAATISVSGTTATLNPSAALAGSTSYTATITTAVKDAAGNALAANASWSFTTGAAPDVTPPTVTGTTPTAGATGVSRTAALTATFSEPMNNATLTTTSVTLVPTAGGAAIAGTVTVTGNVATFTPGAALAGTTQYSATITTAAKDVAGNALAADVTWTFTTAAAPDVTPPTITGSTPANGATGVAADVAPTVTFSEAMTNGTITTSSVTLTPTAGGASLAGSVTVAGTTATLTPAAPLAASTQYTVTVTTAVKDAAGNALAANASWSFTTGAAPDVTPPTVVSTAPVSGATGVSRAAALTATFSEPINGATLTTTTFTLKPAAGGAVIAGTVTASGTTATFTPGAALPGSTQFAATITTAAKDEAGNALASNYTWTFTTAAAPDVTPPTITASTPANGAIGVATTVAPTVTFSEPMQNATLTTATFSVVATSGGASVAGAVSVSGNTATFTPAGALTAGTQYTVTVTTGARDAAGNALAANTSWSFTTAAPADVTPPTVTARSPAPGANLVNVNTTVSATFSEPMQNATITTGSFTVVRMMGNQAIAGTISVSGNTATFTPSAPLQTGNREYIVTITTAVKDLAGNPLASAVTWTFRTTFF